MKQDYSKPHMLFCGKHASPWWTNALWFGIAFCTNPRKVIRGNFVPSHEAVGFDGVVVEAHIDDGVTMSRRVNWLKDNAGRVVYAAFPPRELNFSESFFLEDKLRTAVGTRYESIPDFLKMMVDANPQDADTTTCSELGVKFWPKYLQPQGDNAENTDPSEHYEYCKANGWKIERVKL